MVRSILDSMNSSTGSGSGAGANSKGNLGRGLQLLELVWADLKTVVEFTPPQSLFELLGSGLADHAITLARDLRSKRGTAVVEEALIRAQTSTETPTPESSTSSATPESPESPESSESSESSASVVSSGRSWLVEQLRSEADAIAAAAQASLALAVEIVETAAAAGFGAFGSDLFELLAHAAAANGNVQLTEIWIERMQAAGHKMSPQTYALLIQANGVAKDAFRAQEWFEKSIASLSSPTSAPFVAMAHAAVQCGRVPASIEVLKSMAETRVAPFTTGMLNSVLRLLAESADFASLLSIYKRIDSEKGLPAADAITHGFAILAMYVLGMRSESLQLCKTVGADKLRTTQLNLAVRMLLENGEIDLAVDYAKTLFKNTTAPKSDLLYLLLSAVVKSDKGTAGAIALFKEVFPPANKASSSDKAASAVPAKKKPMSLYDRSPSAEIALVSLVNSLGSDFRAILDACLYAQSVGIFVRLDAMLKLNDAFRKATPEQIKALSNDDLFGLFRVFADPIGLNYRQSEKRNQNSRIILSILKRIKELDMAPTEEINILVTLAFARGNDGQGAADWRVAVRQYNFYTVLIPKFGATNEGTSKLQNNIALINDHISTGKLDEAMALFKQVHDGKSYLPVQVISSLMVAQSKKQNSGAILEILSTSLKAYEALPKNEGNSRALFILYDIAIQTLALAGAPRQALQIAVEMLQKIEKCPSARVVDILFSAANRPRAMDHTNAGRVLTVYEAVKREYKDADAIKTPNSLYLALFRAYGLLDRVVDTKLLAASLKAKNVPITQEMYRVIIQTYASSDGHESHALQAFDDYLDSIRKPAVAVINILMNMYAIRLENGDGAMRIWNVALQQNVMPNADTLRYLLHTLCVLKKDIKAAEEIFATLASGDAGSIQPSAAMYEILMRGYGQGDEKDLERIVTLFDTMSARGVEPNPITYETAITTLAASKSVSLAKQLRQRMISHGCKSAPRCLTMAV
eukprot:jgi/Hompol1/559/HPOL_004164-RA